MRRRSRLCRDATRNVGPGPGPSGAARAAAPRTTRRAGRRELAPGRASASGRGPPRARSGGGRTDPRSAVARPGPGRRASVPASRDWRCGGSLPAGSRAGRSDSGRSPAPRVAARTAPPPATGRLAAGGSAGSGRSSARCLRPAQGALGRSLPSGVVHPEFLNPARDRSPSRRIRLSQQVRDAPADHHAVVRAPAGAQRIDQTHDFYGLGGRGLRVTAGARAGALQPAPTMGPRPPRGGATAQTARRYYRGGTRAARPWDTPFSGDFAGRFAPADPVVAEQVLDPTGRG